jgi:hypothetical protein
MHQWYLYCKGARLPEKVGHSVDGERSCASHLCYSNPAAGSSRPYFPFDSSTVLHQDSRGKMCGSDICTPFIMDVMFNTDRIDMPTTFGTLWTCCKVHVLR